MDSLYPHAQDGNIPTSSGIYKITCTANKKIYLGSTKNLRTRGRDHFNKLRANKHHNPKLQASWNKYAPDAFTFEIVELVLPMSLTAREQYWFKRLNPFGKRGFNIARDAAAPPNVRGVKRSPEFRKNQSARMLGNTYGVGRKNTPESIEKTRSTHLGVKHSPEQVENMRQARWVNRLDRTVSPTTRAKMSQSRTGLTRSPEAIEKTRKANTGKKHTPESLERMRQAKLGKKMSPEARENMRQAGMKRSPELMEKMRQAKKKDVETWNL